MRSLVPCWLSCQSRRRYNQLNGKVDAAGAAEEAQKAVEEINKGLE